MSLQRCTLHNTSCPTQLSSLKQATRQAGLSPPLASWDTSPGTRTALKPPDLPSLCHGSFQPRQVQLVLAKVTYSGFFFFSRWLFLSCRMSMNMYWLTQIQRSYRGEKYLLLRCPWHPFDKNQVGTRQRPCWELLLLLITVFSGPGPWHPLWPLPFLKFIFFRPSKVLVSTSRCPKPYEACCVLLIWIITTKQYLYFVPFFCAGTNGFFKNKQQNSVIF